jgi:hypothetical protein
MTANLKPGTRVRYWGLAPHWVNTADYFTSYDWRYGILISTDASGVYAYVRSGGRPWADVRVECTSERPIERVALKDFPADFSAPIPEHCIDAFGHDFAPYRVARQTYPACAGVDPEIWINSFTAAALAKECADAPGPELFFRIDVMRWISPMESEVLDPKTDRFVRLRRTADGGWAGPAYRRGLLAASDAPEWKRARAVEAEVRATARRLYLENPEHGTVSAAQRACEQHGNVARAVIFPHDDDTLAIRDDEGLAQDGRRPRGSREQ